MLVGERLQDFLAISISLYTKGVWWWSPTYFTQYLLRDSLLQWEMNKSGGGGGEKSRDGRPHARLATAVENEYEFLLAMHIRLVRKEGRWDPGESV
jgi:hypothetical protein